MSPVSWRQHYAEGAPTEHAYSDRTCAVVAANFIRAADAQPIAAVVAASFRLPNGGLVTVRPRRRA